MIRSSIVLFISVLVHLSCKSQQSSDLLVSKQDSLRGSITKERAWWDVVHYQITVDPNFEQKTISGRNTITFRTIRSGRKMQIDLQQPMEIISATYNNRSLQLSRNGNVCYVEFEKMLPAEMTAKVTLYFSGKPREAVNPPWDGGWIWKQGSYGNPWMSVACQGLGASVWYPCKDHQSDEPDSASLSIVCPDTLSAVGNGRLRSIETRKNKKVYTWAVTNPINNYNIIPYIGKYASWSEKYNGEKGILDVSYYVLQENVDRAKKQFNQVMPMLKCFEHWFGPYPFYEDGFKLVESPHLGMEHQSAIAYGNGFQNGYLGKDLSGTGWGKKWDFIIIHESGHEWFGNSITSKDIADMWIHEGFTNYSEVIYTQCEYGKEAGNEYARGLRKNIQNDKPLIAQYGVNKEGSVDMYNKGSNLVHTIRQLFRDDEKFRLFLRSMNEDFRYQTVTSAQIEAYISRKLGRDLTSVFDQYLRTVNVPVFEYRIRNGKLRYRWNNTVKGFDMPLLVTGQKEVWLYPTSEWKEMNWTGEQVSVNPDFYITSSQL